MLCLLLCAGLGFAAERQQNLDSFEHVWKTVRDKHWDPKLGGLDWQKVHDELRPKIERAKSPGEVREILEDMLSRLKQTHFGIIPGDAYSDLEKADTQHEGSVGMEVRVVAGQALVTGVYEDKPAHQQGVKPGWEIVSVDGQAVAPGLRRVEQAFGSSTLKDIRLMGSVMWRLGGNAGEPVEVEFRDGAGRKAAVRMVRAAPRGRLVRFGYMPPVYVWFESRKIGGRIGYVRFNMFMDLETVMPAMERAVKACLSCDGFIVDLRGNPGGIGGMSMGMAGWFVEKGGQKLGAMTTREASLKFAILPRPQVFTGPLAVLVDGATASTAEIFAGGLQDLGRARIFGSRTAGAALPSAIERLPNGDGFQYAQANYISEGGRPLEGLGVTPDVTVPPSREALLAGRDTALEAALEWIRAPKGR